MFSDPPIHSSAPRKKADKIRVTTVNKMYSKLRKLFRQGTLYATVQGTVYARATHFSSQLSLSIN